MHPESSLLPLSGLQHLVFCERQWGLIHLEQVWVENMLTAQGRVLHERTHAPKTEVRGDRRIVRALRLRSLRLGLVGVADVVEFHAVRSAEPLVADLENASANPFPPAHAESAATDPMATTCEGIALPGAAGRWRPFPVEYKRGRPKRDHSDMVQLCAQALCLEEMLGTYIESGALFYGRQHRRLEVHFSPALRDETERLAARMHSLFENGRTPSAAYLKKCDACSLVSVCRPKSIQVKHSARRYFHIALRDMGDDPP